MGSISDEWHVTADALAQRLRPRDDLLVLEAVLETGADAGSPVGEARFSCIEGPFRRYERRLRWRHEADAVVVTQEIEWQLGIPYWSWLYRPVVGRALRHGIAAGQRPWWNFPDRLTLHQARTVATMALFSLVAGFLYGPLTQVLTFASADIGNGTSAQQATIFALVRVGAVLTAVAMFQADRFGRRRVGLWCFATAITLTVATAFVPGLGALTVLQAISRNLALAGLLAVDTICVEELPAGSRAMAAGLGAMAYGLGSGIVVMSLPLADVGAAGWRLVFGLTIVTAPMAWSASRHLRESGRFRALPSAPTTGSRSEPGTAAASRPREATRIRGSRFVLLALLFLLVNVFIAPMSQLQNDYLRADRGFDGLTITVFTILTGTPAAIGVIVGGRIADTRGRRLALIPGLLAIAVFGAAFFTLSGAAMWVSALAAAVLGTLTVAPLGVLAPELFPTARRGSARGALNVLAVGGSVLGLVVAGFGVDAGGYSLTFVLLALAPLGAAALALAVPETGGRELEELNPAER